MRLKVINSNSEFEAIKTDWNNLLTISASHVPFLRHEYLTTWWKTLGGGEWKHGELYIIAAYADSPSEDYGPGDLIGIAPFFLTENLDGKSALMFLGSIEISDYLDFIAPPEILPAFIDAVIVHLVSPVAPDWEVLDLYNILESSAALPFLEEASQKYNLTYAQEKIQPAPSINLPASYEDYLNGIKKKQRHEIRRKVRRAETHDVPVRWYIVKDENKLDEEINAFLNLMAQDSEKESFLSDVMRTQMRESIHTAFDAGWLQFAFLEVGGEKAAAYVNFDFANQLWVYNSGINFKFYDLSPGWVLLAYLIEWATQNGREVLDFMRGDEVYKYRFGGIDRYVMRVQVHQ